MRLRDIKKNNKNYDISLIDLLKLIDPSKNGKFISLLLSELKCSDKTQHRSTRTTDELGIDSTNLSSTTLDVLNLLCGRLGGESLLVDMIKFNELLGKGQVKNNDITQYKTLNDISLELVKVEERLSGKKLSPKQDIIFEDDEYLVIKPLNLDSSRKYGRGTKWCTSARDSNYFYDYSRGVLLYVIGKGVNPKWGVHFDMENVKLTWWDAADEQFDGLLVDMPSKLKKFIVNYITEEKYPNNTYFDVETFEESSHVLADSRQMPQNRNWLDFVNDNHRAYQNNQELPTIDLDGAIFEYDEDGDDIVDSTWRNMPVEELITSQGYTTTSTVDSMVNKTLEYMYTIDTMKKGGKLM
tara:strand:+ start:260 stop:1321 length:1062 start_codon:yes stop_codon:yes gene_type:complete